MAYDRPEDDSSAEDFLHGILSGNGDDGLTPAEKALLLGVVALSVRNLTKDR